MWRCTLKRLHAWLALRVWSCCTRIFQSMCANQITLSREDCITVDRHWCRSLAIDASYWHVISYEYTQRMVVTAMLLFLFGHFPLLFSASKHVSTEAFITIGWRNNRCEWCAIPRNSRLHQWPIDRHDVGRPKRSVTHSLSRSNSAWKIHFFRSAIGHKKEIVGKRKKISRRTIFLQKTAPDTC